MTLLFDKHHAITSPALAPVEGDVEQDGAARAEIAIGLINNMPDSALKATERQFQRLIHAASGTTRVRFHCFSLPSVARSASARRHVDGEYDDIADLGRLRIDGLIVTGAEPVADTLPQEPYWRDLCEIVDWARTNTRSAIWSCLAAHAAVLHLDGVARHRLQTKCSGVYDCASISCDWLINGAPAMMRISHSRHNALKESDLVDHGYQILTRSEQAGVDIFVKQFRSRFVFFQGHPEYDALSLQREYMRDIARFLAHERNDYPLLPVAYFDSASEEVLGRFETRARLYREPTLAAELPGLTLRRDLATDTPATLLFRNWISFLRNGGASAAARSASVSEQALRR